jgi:hypothetical protein
MRSAWGFSADGKGVPDMSSASDGSVDLFADDVGVSGVTGRLLDHVDVDPSQR